MQDCHLRAEGAAAGLVLPKHGWGCLTAQKPTQHWLPANYRPKEAAACLFLGCRGIHLHFCRSSWANQCEFHWAKSAIFPISPYVLLTPNFSLIFLSVLYLIPPPSVFSASVGGAFSSPLSHLFGAWDKHMSCWLWSSGGPRSFFILRSQFRVLSCSHDNEEVLSSLLILTNTCSNASPKPSASITAKKGCGMSERFQDSSNRQAPYSSAWSRKCRCFNPKAWTMAWHAYLVFLWYLD